MNEPLQTYPAAPASVLPPEPMPEPRSRRARIIGLVAAAVLLIGAAVAAYFLYFRQPDPYLVIAQALQHDAESKTDTTTFDLKVQSAEFAEAFSEITTDIGGTSVTSTPDQQWFFFRGTAQNDQRNADKMLTSANIQLGLHNGAQETKAVISTVGSGDVVYFKLDELPKIGFLSFLNLSSQWIKFDAKEIQNLYSNFSGNSATSTGITADTLGPKMKELAEALQKNRPYTVQKVHRTELIGKTLAFHYTLALDEQGLRGFIAEASRITGEAAPTEEDLSQLLSLWKEDLQSPVLDVWISRTSKEFVRIAADHTMNNPDDPSQKIRIQLVIEPTYNTAVSITEPADAQSITDLLRSMGLTPPEATTSTMEATDLPVDAEMTKDSDNDGISDYMETSLYGSNPMKADTDGDGFKDGDEVKNNYNPNGPGKL